MLATVKSTRKKPRQLILYINHLAHSTSRTDVTTVENSRSKTMTSAQKEGQGSTVQAFERGENTRS